MLNDCFGNKVVTFQMARNNVNFWVATLLNFDAVLLHQEMMAFRRKVEIVVP